MRAAAWKTLLSLQKNMFIFATILQRKQEEVGDFRENVNTWMIFAKTNRELCYGSFETCLMFQNNKTSHKYSLYSIACSLLAIGNK